MEREVQPLELILALLLILDEIEVAPLLLNRETRLFYFLVGNQYFRWKEPTAAGEQQMAIPMPKELTGPVLEINSWPVTVNR